MSAHAVTYAWDAKDISLSQRCVLAAIGWRARPDRGHWADEVSTRELSEELGANRRTIQRILKQLEDAGVLIREAKARESGSADKNRYGFPGLSAPKKGGGNITPGVAADCRQGGGLLPPGGGGPHAAPSIKRTTSSNEEERDGQPDGLESSVSDLRDRGMSTSAIHRLRARYLTPTSGNLLKLEESERERVLDDALDAFLIEKEGIPHSRFLDRMVEVRVLDVLRNRSRTESSGTVLLR